MRRKLNFRKIGWLILSSFIICAFMLTLTADTALAKRNFVRFGGSNPGGSWFTIAGGITTLFNTKLSDVNVTPVSTGGSTDNNRQARKHNLDTWLTHSITAYDNWNGVGHFKGQGKFQDFRMLAGVYESWHHFVVLDKSDIKSISDLAGKKIAVGSAGSGAAANSENILRALGLWDKVKPQHLTFSASGRALTDGHADAVSLSSAPMPAIVTVEAMHKIRLISLSDAEFKTVLTKYPAYKKAMMPPGVYKSWDKEYPCIAFQVYWVAHKETEPEWVQKMLQVAFDPANKKFLGRVHRQLKTLSPSFDGMKSMGIPLHPGAVNYYKAAGMTIPKELMP